MTNEQKPRIGVGVLIKKDGMVLMGERTGSHGNKTYAPPGGHLEFGETIIDCALREVMEETGLIVSNPTIATFSEDFYADEGKHYVTFLVTVDWTAGEPEVKEPDKCLGWDWYQYEQLPAPLFLSMQNMVDNGYHPFK